MPKTTRKKKKTTTRERALTRKPASRSSRTKKKTKRKKFKYKVRGEDAVKKRARDQGGMYDSVYTSDAVVWTPKEGDHRIRILPPTWDEDAPHFGLDAYVHYNVGPDNQAYLCPERMKRGEACPVCEEIREAKQRGEGDEEWVRKLWVSRRVWVYVIVRGQESEGPQLFPMAKTLDTELSNACQDKHTGEIFYIDDPDKGYDVSFTREGSGLKTKYIGCQIARRASPISSDADTQEEWLEFISDNTLLDCMNIYSAEHIAEALGGSGVRASDIEEDEEEAPKTRSSARRRKVKEPEEEEEDEEEEEEEEEEDWDEDEEEDEDDEEEEDEEEEEDDWEDEEDEDWEDED